MWYFQAHETQSIIKYPYKVLFIELVHNNENIHLIGSMNIYLLIKLLKIKINKKIY